MNVTDIPIYCLLAFCLITSLCMFYYVLNHTHTIPLMLLAFALEVITIFLLACILPKRLFAKDIRKPISHNAEVVTTVALDCCGTYWPDERLKDSGDQWTKTDYPQLYFYYDLMDHYIKDKGGNAAYSSCTQFVSAVLAATVDENAWKGSWGCQEFIEYCLEHPSDYQYLGTIPFATLRPGDLISSKRHTAIYIGNPIGLVAEAGYTTHQYPGTTLWRILGRHTLGELIPWSDYVTFRIK